MGETLSTSDTSDEETELTQRRRTMQELHNIVHT